MRQAPIYKSQFWLIFPFFLIIIIDVMSTSITGPVFAYAVQHPELHILGLLYRCPSAPYIIWLVKINSASMQCVRYINSWLLF